MPIILTQKPHHQQQQQQRKNFIRKHNNIMHVCLFCRNPVPLRGVTHEKKIVYDTKKK